ncbi:hypothetical protein F511_20394 [Dorcoceras hygrometricum]|uniref:Uncharacterized protein n=1 Tax=Dorcoceras hygrometricum TaxID=472368 RepID=A0A2Z7AMQ0_9LAMI|nr:hypothetical protein F511_20394 [Dorcoceras hygrometricum]
MRSVVASHGPGSNPRGNAICNAILLQSFPVLQIFGLQYLDRHRPPSSDVLPLNLKKSAVTTSPELHRSGGRPAAAPHEKCTAAERDVAPSATHGRAQRLAPIAHRRAISAPQASTSSVALFGQQASSAQHRAQRPATMRAAAQHHRPTIARPARDVEGPLARRERLPCATRRASLGRRPSASSRKRDATSALVLYATREEVRACAHGGERGPPHTAAAGRPIFKI